MNNRKYGKSLVAAMAASVLLVSTGQAAGPLWMSNADMEVESAKQFAEMKASMPLITDRETIDYIACVANAVVSVLEPPYSDIEWEMAIFEVDSVNAFAMPGGKIGVMEGILKAAQNQHQLAAVIGHEIAHVTAEHSNERASRGKLSNVGIQVAAVLLGGGHRARPTPPTRHSTRARHSASCCRLAVSRKVKQTSLALNTWHKPDSIRDRRFRCGRT